MSRAHVLRVFAASLALSACMPLAAQDDADTLAAGLVRLRGEVEQLNTELDLLREEQRAALAGLNAQKAELAASVERQQLAARELRGKLDARREAAAAAGVAGEDLLPLLGAAVSELERHIATGLPFKREERLAELATFRTAIGNGSLPAPRAVNRLWAYYEDELRLTRDNSLHTQTIALDDEQVLAEVAKLGTMALYFRTRDGRVGQAVRTDGDSWSFVTFDEAADIAQVEALFGALQARIRQGWFELPMAAAGDGR